VLDAAAGLAPHNRRVTTMAHSTGSWGANSSGAQALGDPAAWPGGEGYAARVHRGSDGPAQDSSFGLAVSGDEADGSSGLGPAAGAWPGSLTNSGPLAQAAGAGAPGGPGQYLAINGPNQMALATRGHGAAAGGGAEASASASAPEAQEKPVVGYF
jgi:hypothetical protein